ncbi:MAG: hypothetical protein IPO27_02850 [Bacteroidetes bacterium]|nr:hypothetical protein [Bacteroidota bacterium]
MKKITKPETRTGTVFAGGNLVALCLLSNVMVAQFKAATIPKEMHKNVGPTPNTLRLSNLK